MQFAIYVKPCSATFKQTFNLYDSDFFFYDNGVEPLSISLLQSGIVTVRQIRKSES